MQEGQILFTPEEEEELIPLLNQGKVILFLGVGFSIDAKNKRGLSIPTAKVLANTMNQILLASGETGFQGNNLIDLKLVSESFYRFYKDSPKAIDNFFKSFLTVDRTKIPNSYQNLKKVNWNGIYTTNFDDLLEAIYESSDEEKIAYKKSAYKRTNSDLPDDNEFNIVYLNGDLNCNARIENPNEVIVTDLICSSTDFATSKTPVIWDYFIDKFRQYPIIIVGSQLNEESFYSIYGELINKTNIKCVNRPRSYIINFDSNDQKFEDLKNTYNLHHKVAGTSDFLDWIAQKKELRNSRYGGNIEISSSLPKIANIYTEFTADYWDSLKGIKSKDDLIKYYTNINSSPRLLPYVIAEEFYILPDEEVQINSISSQLENVHINLEELFPKETGNHNIIIRINANGGTGKSTLLLHIGKKYFKKFHILYIKELTDNVTSFPKYSNDKTPVLILFDNYGKQIEKLKIFSQALNDLYFERGYCLVTTERHIRESILDSDIKKQLDENFSEVINCTFNHNSAFYEKIFDKIIQLVDSENKLTIKHKFDLKERISANSKATTAERIIDFMLSVKHANLGFQFSFDWEDWEKFCIENVDFNKYSNLYSIVAAFNNYDITPPIRFCIDTLGIVDPNLISTFSLFSRPNFDFPITIQKDKCFELRNPNLAEWYIKEKDCLGLLTKKYFKDALINFKTNEQLYFLRNAYRNYLVVKDDNLKLLIPSVDKLLKIFKEFVISNPCDADNSKNKMEMVVIHLKNQNVKEAKEILYEMISDCCEDLHARTKLADILIKEQNFEEAKPIVDSLTKEAPKNNYILKLRIAILKDSADELSVLKKLIEDLPKEHTANLRYLYAKLAKLLRLSGNLVEAEEYCNRLLQINKYDYGAMNTLSMIYQKQNKLNEAEDILIKSIEIQPYNPHSYNELGQVYIQLYDRTDNIDYKYKALRTFIKGLRKSKGNIPLRTEFARFLVSYCNKFSFAENILLNNLQQDPFHFHSYTELGIIYQKQFLYQKSREILEKGRSQLKKGNRKDDRIPMLVVLGYVYLDFREYKKAEEVFRETIDLKPANWASHIGISKAFLKQSKEFEFEIEFKRIQDEIIDVTMLCEFSNWLRTNGRLNDSMVLILKAKALNGEKQNRHLCAIQATIVLEKLIQYKFYDSLEVLQLIGQCEKICFESLKMNPNDERILYILIRLYQYLKEKTRDRGYLRNNYTRSYNKYLGQYFLLNKSNPYVLECIINHLKTTRRHRLAIAFIKEYGNLNLSPLARAQKLSKFYGFLDNKKELELLEQFAIKNNLGLSHVVVRDNHELVSQDNIGILLDKQIKYGNKLINLSNLNLNISRSVNLLSNKPDKGVKVFFGIYKIEEELFANNIEPYFESIPNDASVLKLLELENTI